MKEAPKEWEFTKNDVRFFCWADEEGGTHTSCSSEDEPTIQGLARMMVSDGCQVTITSNYLEKSHITMWTLYAKLPRSSPSIQVYEGDGVRRL